MSAAIDLVYFDGCPHVAAARKNLGAALAASGLPAVWDEHNQSDAALPAAWRGFPSPTILVDGCDVSGATEVAASACRASGAPSIEMICEALRGARGESRAAAPRHVPGTREERS